MAGPGGLPVHALVWPAPHLGIQRGHRFVTEKERKGHAEKIPRRIPQTGRQVRNRLRQRSLHKQQRSLSILTLAKFMKSNKCSQNLKFKCSQRSQIKSIVFVSFHGN